MEKRKGGRFFLIKKFIRGIKHIELTRGKTREFSIKIIDGNERRKNKCFIMLTG